MVFGVVFAIQALGAQPHALAVEAKCGLENCHGVDYVCGAKPAEFCTLSIEPGDGCRRFAHCAVDAKSGKCQLDVAAHPGVLECQKCFREKCANATESIASCEELCIESATQAEKKPKARR